MPGQHLALHLFVQPPVDLGAVALAWSHFVAGCEEFEAVAYCLGIVGSAENLW